MPISQVPMSHSVTPEVREGAAAGREAEKPGGEEGPEERESEIRYAPVGGQSGEHRV